MMGFFSKGKCFREGQNFHAKNYSCVEVMPETKEVRAPPSDSMWITINLTQVWGEKHS